MAPNSSQYSASQKKSKSSSSRINTLKFDTLAPSSSQATKRFNPLTAFAKSPEFEIGSDVSVSQKNIEKSGQEKGKGKAKEKIKSVSQCDPDSRDDRLWVDIYEPTTQAELAVHQKKVEDVRRWLGEAFDGGPSGKLKKYRRILALTGPAGTAKTTTIRVLAREMGFEILEWRNAMGDHFSNEFNDPDTSEPFRDQFHDHEALFTKFQAFLTRASTCRNIFTTIPSSSPSPSSSSSQPSCSNPSSQMSQPTTKASVQIPPYKRQIILLEDLPNILHPRTQSQFHDALQSFVVSPPSSPLVIIVSDAGMRGEASDERMASGGGWGKDRDGVMDIRTVLPRELLGGPYVTQIGFNPIAPTLLRKALQALLHTHFSSSRVLSSFPGATVTPPSKEYLDIIVESANGDIRSAVMALQFACVIDVGEDTKGKGRGKKSLKGGPNGMRVVLEAVTRREQSLALFHLIGKVLYNKRKGDPQNSSASAKDVQKDKDLDARLKDPPKIPWFLAEHERRPSRVDVDTLYADSPIDSSLFSLYIHQNYPQFCNDVDECNGIADWLSWVDSSGGEAWYQANPRRFHLLTLGTLHSLPSPVVRRSQKIFKPEYFDVLQREKAAWDGVGDVRGWLVEEGIGVKQGGLAWRVGGWSKTDVVTELGGVLKARDVIGSESRPPPSHQLFSNLVFKFGKDSVTGVQPLGESDVGVDGGEEVAEDGLGTGAWSDRKIVRGSGGWLEDDDIKDF